MPSRNGCTMTIKRALFSCTVLCGLVLTVQAHAATTGGLDTPQGVQSLPLAVEGNPIITLSDQNNVETATVSGSVNTSGYMQPGGYADNVQPACNATNQGALIYSTTQKTTLVCNGTAWVSLSGGASCSAAAMSAAACGCSGEGASAVTVPDGYITGSAANSGMGGIPYGGLTQCQNGRGVLLLCGCPGGGAVPGGG
jgi:hypothetical protein